MGMTGNRASEVVKPTKKVISSSLFFGYRGEEKDDRCYADRVIGLERVGGALCASQTCEPLYFNEERVSVGADPIKMFFHWYEEEGVRKKLCFVYATDGYLYRYTTNFGLSAGRMIFPRKPDCFTYKETSGGNFFVIAGNQLTYRYATLTRTYYNIDSVPDNTHAILHYERMFVLDSENNDLIHYSKALDMTDFSKGVQDGGSIELPRDKGKCIGFLSFSGQLWIVRERGLTRLTALGDNRNFTVKHFDLDVGNIQEDKFIVCGAYILLVTDRGLFRFDGSEAVEMNREIFSLLDKQTFGAPAAHGGVFYMGAKTREGEDTSLKWNPETGEATLLPFYGKVFGSSGEGLYFVGEDKNFYRVKEKSAEDEYRFLWRCAHTDFGAGGKRKVLKRFTLSAEGNYLLTVRARGRIFQKECSGSCTVQPNLPSDSFTVSVSGSFAKLKFWEAELHEY